MNAGTQAFVANADLVKRTVFAREMLPVSSVLSYGINFTIESLVVVGFIPIFPHAFHLGLALFLVPVFVVVLAALLAGVALAMSVLNVIYRDVAYLVNTGLLLLYWLTPVMYPTSVIPMPWRSYLQWNPAGAIMEAVRGAVMLGEAPSLLGWARMVLPTLLVLALGWLIFRRHARVALDYV